MNTVATKETIIERVEASLENRHRDLRMTPKARRQDEATFLAGACCALQATFGKPTDEALTDYIPPAWVLAPMCGRLLADLKKRNGDK